MGAAMTAAAFALVLGIAAPASATPASATPECTIRIVRPVTDDMGNRWQPGRHLPATILRRDAKAGDAFCAHGGSCVPRAAAVLDDCVAGAAIGGGDYRLEPDPKRLAPATLRAMRRRDAAEAKLSAMGFSNAAAATLAEDHAARPRSRTGRLVTQALAGSRVALAALRRRMP